jgi:hypothetical protein
MKYYVHANTLDTFTATQIKHVEEFNDYNKALDYYRDTFKSQSELIVDLGGNHTIMLYTKENNDVQIIKRQTIDTTINNLVEND